MYNFYTTSYNMFVHQALGKLLEEGVTVAPRGQVTRELRAVTFEIADPTARTMTLARRNSNIFATVAETLWFLGGRNDLDFVKPYLPRYEDYSDDGTILHGAYGARMLHWNGVDQLHSVLERLAEDPMSRRAVIILYNPALDNSPSKDIPCNNWLQFLIRGDQLHLHVVQRSQDVIWGGTIDVFQWTVLQELVAGWLGLRLGQYTHFVGSLHLYERHFDRGKRIIEESLESAYLPRPLAISCARFDFETIIRTCFVLEAEARHLREPKLTELPTGWFREAIRMLWSYHVLRQNNLGLAKEILAAVECPALRHAGALYINRFGTGD